MGSLGGGERFGAVSARWNELVGDTVAEHAEPCGLRDGVLVVGVREPGWATQLRFLGPEIVERCDATLGPEVVERVEVRVLRSRA
jgi:predicted nucleic acid-binding Zn ribbon protein